MVNIYNLATNNVSITVKPEYLEFDSVPSENHFVWLYHIEIENKREDAIQLLSRYWSITDGKGVIQEVRGKGVVGQSPTILPNDNFRYTSSVNLQTSSGLMYGFYDFKNGEQEKLKIPIPVFSLDSFEQLQKPN